MLAGVFIDCMQVRPWRVLLLLRVWCRVKRSNFNPPRPRDAGSSCMFVVIYRFSPAKAVSLHLAARCSPGSFFTPSRLQLSKHAGRAWCSSRRALLPLHVCVRCSEMWSLAGKPLTFEPFFLFAASKETIFQRIYRDLPEVSMFLQFGIFSSERWTPAILLVECCGSLPPACA